MADLGAVQSGSHAWRLRIPLTLPISVLSVILVAAVGLLMAFMQYQARLLRLQPTFSVGQLVYFIETENKIADNLATLTSLSKVLADKNTDVIRIENEITFRVNRICTKFAEEKDQKKCATFLYQIPFDDGAAKLASSTSQQAGSSAGAIDPKSNPTPISNEQLASIRDRFIDVMNDDPFVGKAKFSEIINMYLPDLRTIADKNQQHALSLYPEVIDSLKRFQSLCQYQLVLLSIVEAYHNTDSGVCRDFGNLLPTSVGREVPASDLTGGSARALEMPAEGAGQATSSAKQPPLPGPTPAAPPSPPSVSSPAQPQVAGPVSGTPPIQPVQLNSAPPGPTPSLQASSRDRVNLSTADKQRVFELVNNYMFYEKLSGSYFKGVLLSPADFLALLLVTFSGVLGALLRIVLAAYVTGQDPTFRNFVVGPILGLICALVVYILFRAGFIAITDQSQGADTSSLSPFVVAILSIAAGLLSERAIDLFRQTSGKWLGSVEASQVARYGVHLGKTIADKGYDPAKIAVRIGVAPEKMNDWVAEKDAVPIDKQRELELVLETPVRKIFTDLAPAQAV